MDTKRAAATSSDALLLEYSHEYYLSRPVNPHESRRILEETIASLRELSLEQLQRYLDDETREIIGESGTRYSVEIKAFWDDAADRYLRVRVAIDDGGWRAMVPKTSSFIIAADGSFVDE